LQYLSVPSGLRYHLAGGKFSFNPAIAIAANFIKKRKSKQCWLPQEEIKIQLQVIFKD
jgi:hypothetical protein